MALEEICFPNNIRNIRLSRGMRMTALAKKSGLSLSAMSKVEKGVRRLKQSQLMQLCGILGCKLSDIFIKADDSKASLWKSEMQRRLVENETSGLKVFGAGIRILRRGLGKTIAQAAKDAKMTLSVYHKIEIGQREVYEREIDNLAKALGKTVDGMFKAIAELYNSGALAKQIDKAEERVREALTVGKSATGSDIGASIYGATVYDSVRKNLVPVYGTPEGKNLSFAKSDENMIALPAKLKNGGSVYAVRAPANRLGAMFPANSYLFVSPSLMPSAGDLAVVFEEDFEKIKPGAKASARVVMLKEDKSGNLIGVLTNPEEKIQIKNPKNRLHKVVQVVLE
ncbi:MAG: XRE family transcriptional regulator [Alphaproteobacteria bacterium]|nr:XRE family transcriptional regulator [Alphaproteobacteria bacterium]